jgi:amidohydrolase
VVIQAIQQIVSRRLNPIEAGVVTIGTIHGGAVENVIPDIVEMTGTLRSYTHETRQLLRDELRRVCGVIEALGGTFELRILEGYPPTINHPEATATAVEALTALLGREHVHEAELGMGAEDFSVMAQEAPGCFLRLGVLDPAWDKHYQLHRADFRLNEDALPIGAAALAAAALQWMETKQ